MSVEARLRVEYTVTREDVYRFLLYNLLHNRLLVGLLAAEFLFLFGITMNRVSYHFSGVPTSLSAVCGLLVVAAVLLLYRQRLWQASKGSGVTVGTLGEHTIEISPDGLVATSPRGEAKLKWTSFARIVGAPDYVYLYLGKRLATIIPRRAFPSLAASEQFLRAAKEWHADELSLNTS
jgi:hypothetical protein